MDMKSRLLLLIMLFAVPATFLQGQKITITGVVTDKNKVPVAGATILVDNKSTDKITNSEGAYKVKVKEGSKIISVITPSGSLAESAIDGRTEINFSLSHEALSEANKMKNDKGEEDVNVGYGTVKKKDLNSNVGKVDGINSKYASYKDIYEMLRNQPGVQVSGTSIRIQGASSLTSGTEPLYVVDGIVVSSIDYIRPVSVKSIEILKGPSASIYGSRGANGVILITLISGKE
jgi:TonB-dependent SusC/RagA subfamily outer membrane receptor